MIMKESEVIELKASTAQLKKALIAISAMLNKHGKGTVYFGIKDDGIVIGQQIGKATLKDIAKTVSDHIEPKIFPEIEIEELKGKTCVKVDFTGQENLYSAYGNYYIRIGDENRKLTGKEIERLIAKKQGYVYPWGASVSETPVAKADVRTLRSFIKKGKEAGRIGFSFDSAKNILNKLHLSKGDMLNNAGKALFSKDNPVKIQAAVFAGIDRITFLDIQRFEGNLFELAEKGGMYIREHMNWRADLSGSKRIEIPEVPIRALNEAIINSLCHRDFTNPKHNELAIFRDRIEVFNPGKFPFDYSPSDFIKGNEKSIPRNPLIADIFYLAKDIEGWGSGIKRIYDECKEAGVKVKFEILKSGFQITFYRSSSKSGKQGDGTTLKSDLKSDLKSAQKTHRKRTENN